MKSSDFYSITCITEVWEFLMVSKGGTGGESARWMIGGLGVTRVTAAIRSIHPNNDTCRDSTLSLVNVSLSSLFVRGLSLCSELGRAFTKTLATRPQVYSAFNASIPSWFASSSSLIISADIINTVRVPRRPIYGHCGRLSCCIPSR